MVGVASRGEDAETGVDGKGYQAFYYLAVLLVQKKHCVGEDGIICELQN